MALAQKEKAGNNAVRMLRRSKLNKGIPFMINTRQLPSRQCYMEYPDGSIKLVRLYSADIDFTVIRNLSAKETEAIRKRYELY
ncbi:MAG: hypothetical protein J7502_02980 [Flavisolibacter sp.]|nr:hypothetical protein [Flavisolibacter sp.]